MASSLNRSVRSLAHQTRALVVRRVPYGEAGVIVGLFTQDLGQVSVLAHGARAWNHAAPAQLEPMHTLRVTLRERPSQPLLSLAAVALETPRRLLTTDWARMEAAGLALQWVRQATPPRTAEPRLWEELIGLLDALDAPQLVASPKLRLAHFGLRLLETLGYALELQQCVGCSRPCEPQRPAYLDAARGGLVCRSCGGASELISAEMRQRMIAAQTQTLVLLESDAPTVLTLVEAALSTHAGVKV